MEEFRIELVLLLVSSLAAAAAAIATFFQSRHSAKMHRVQTFLAAIEVYSSSEMGDALTALIDYKLQYPNDFANRFVVNFRAGAKEERLINNHRRIVSQFFSKIFRLKKMRLVTENDSRFGYMRTGLLVLYWIVIPMSARLVGNDIASVRAATLKELGLAEKDVTRNRDWAKDI
jgi:hypothetical protein